jgi:hypothetical protein
LNDSFAKTTRLALGLEQAAIAIENQVVSLIDAKGNKQRVSTTNELSKDCALRPQTDIDGM